MIIAATTVGAGIYHVNDDCSVVAELHPAPGVLIQERAVLLDNGHELRSISAIPPGSL